MAEVAGLVIGTASVTIQLLDGCVKGYQYFIGAVGMPRECQYMRTRLQIEYSRLLNWCDVAGLTEYKENQDIPEALRTDRLVLVAVLTEIRALLHDCAEVNGQYEELRPDKTSMSPQDIAEIDIVEELSSIHLSYEKKKAERKYPLGMGHILRGASMAKDIAKHPKRLRWVAFDQAVFLKVLTRLRELNDYLDSLLHGYQAGILEQTTEKTYLEIVQVRTTVEGLKNLMAAASLAENSRSDGSPASSARRRRDQRLTALASFKKLNIANEVIASNKKIANHDAMSSTRKNYSQVAVKRPTSGLVDTSPNDGLRNDGVFFPSDGSKCNVWIEWKAYVSAYDYDNGRYSPILENVKRVQELAVLLCSEKASEFLAPRCLGYFDDRDDSEKSEHDARFGLIFEKPTNCGTPVSLRHMIKAMPGSKPCLNERISLAYRIATCTLYINAVKWLHKGLRSDSILFLSESRGSINITEPYVTGYEYARPDRDGETTTGGDVDVWRELYVHPEYQGLGRKGAYQKTFDIYSLGIILLEIANWKCIEDIVGIDPDDVELKKVKSIRQYLLRPESTQLESLRLDIGERYYHAVKSCLEGRSAFGIGPNEDLDAGGGVTLQQKFSQLVVEALEGITI